MKLQGNQARLRIIQDYRALPNPSPQRPLRAKGVLQTQIYCDRFASRPVPAPSWRGRCYIASAADRRFLRSRGLRDPLAARLDDRGSAHERGLRFGNELTLG